VHRPTTDPPEYSGAASPGRSLAFQHQKRDAFARHKAVAPAIEGTHHSTFAERAKLRITGHHYWRQTGFDGAGDHDIGIAVLNVLRS
jgi:hypothetical protein